MATPQSAIVPLDQVAHLAFAGGGGKGLVHIGAVMGMESKLGVRTLSEAKALRGVAGASAGALVAMMVGLGYSGSEVRKQLANYFGPLENVLFVDGMNTGLRPMPRIAADAVLRVGHKGWGELETDAEEGKKQLLRSRMVKDYTYRAIGNEGEDARAKEAEILRQIHQDLYLRTSFANDPRLDDLLYQWELVQDAKVVARLYSNVSNSLQAKLAGVGAEISLQEVAGALFEMIRDELRGTPLQFVVRTRQEFDRFVYNMLFGQGLLPGFVLRESVRRIAAESPIGRRLGILEVEQMTFADLAKLVEKERDAPLDLVVSGTNLTRRSVTYFSRWDTPRFRVIDAVAISMNYPFLFKPVLVRFSEGTAHPLHGNWADGGLLNNLPIHAFDRGPDQVLDHLTVGFRIRDDRRTSTAITAQSMLLSNFRVIFDTLLAQGSEGQIRTEVEELQTVTLDAAGLSTLDLVPNWTVAGKLIIKARKKTQDYFEFRRSCYPVAASWTGKDPDPPVQGRVFQELARNQLRGAYAHVSPRPLYVQPLDSRGRTSGVQSVEVDIVVTNADDGKGEFVLYEAKASKAARLTRRQRAGIERLARFGGYLASSLDEEDGPGEAPRFPTGAKVAAQPLRVLRPGNLCDEFREALRAGGRLADLAAQAKEWRGSDYPPLLDSGKARSGTPRRPPR